MTSNLRIAPEVRLRIRQVGHRFVAERREVCCARSRRETPWRVFAGGDRTVVERACAAVARAFARETPGGTAHIERPEDPPARAHAAHEASFHSSARS